MNNVIIILITLLSTIIIVGILNIRKLMKTWRHDQALFEFRKTQAELTIVLSDDILIEEKLNERDLMKVRKILDVVDLVINKFDRLKEKAFTMRGFVSFIFIPFKASLLEDADNRYSPLVKELNHKTINSFFHAFSCLIPFLRFRFTAKVLLVVVEVAIFIGFKKLNAMKNAIVDSLRANDSNYATC